MQMVKQKVVFIFGAGCSIEDGAPLIYNFFNIAFNEVKPHLNGEQLDRFNRVENFRKSELPGSNVEELLSFIDIKSILDSNPSDNLSQIKDDLIYLIGKTIKHNMGTGKSKSYENFDKNFIPEDARHTLPTIITFNWDIAFDNIIISERYDMTNKLKEGDNIHNIYHVDYGASFNSIDNSYQSHNTTTSGVPPILKLHGSMNWLFCEKCKKDKNPFRYFIYGQKIIVNVFEGDIISCPQCKNKLTPVIVPPTLRKIEENSVLITIKEIWDAAFKALVNAEHIFIVGYSFPPDDVHFKLFLRSALFNNYKERKKPITIDIINYKKYLQEKTDFENHYKKMIDIPEAEIRPRFHYLKFSEFVQQTYSDYIKEDN